MSANVRVCLLFSDLPDSAEVTGRVTLSGGTDARGEENAPTVILEFRRLTLKEVRQKLSGKTYDAISLSDIRFNN